MIICKCHTFLSMENQLDRHRLRRRTQKLVHLYKCFLVSYNENIIRRYSDAGVD